MKNKLLFILVIILSSFYLYQKRSIKNDTSFFNTKVSTNNEDETDVEDYIIHVLAGEMPASFEKESLKAQAIVARSYTYYKILNSNQDYNFLKDHVSQAYLTNDEMHERWQKDFDFYYDKIRDAVTETKNMVVTYNDDVICAYYFAMSNGLTENSQDVFNIDYPYLISVESKEPSNLLVQEKVISKEDFLKNLNLSGNDIFIGEINYDATNRVKTIVINNTTFLGTDVRKLLDLRSTDFQINISSDVQIITKGYGHGVGMSQYGANEYAKNGYSYAEIINHYYQNIKITNINSILSK